MLRNVCIKELESKQPRIGNLSYGCIVNGLPGQPDVLYMKVKTRSPGMGLTIHKSPKHSVLLNLKCGTFREVKGNTYVRIFTADMSLTPVKLEDVPWFTKENIHY